MPTETRSTFVPAGTVIEAVIRNGIVSSAVPGDPVTAFISVPVMVNGRPAIPSGSHLRGNLKKLTAFGKDCQARLTFGVLVIGDKSVSIHSGVVDVVTPVKSDADIVAAAFASLAGATLGSALAAASGDKQLIDRGLIVGAAASMSSKTTVPIAVTLLDDVEF